MTVKKYERLYYKCKECNNTRVIDVPVIYYVDKIEPEWLEPEFKENEHTFNCPICNKETLYIKIDRYEYADLHLYRKSEDMIIKKKNQTFKESKNQPDPNFIDFEEEVIKDPGNKIDNEFKEKQREEELLNKYRRFGTPEELDQLLNKFEDILNEKISEQADENMKEEIPAVFVYVYFKNGNVDKYKVDNEFKAREHAEKIWTSGYRMRVGNRMEWFGPHFLDKVCWDVINEDYLSRKYESKSPK